MNKRLREELEELRFGGQEDVVRRTHPRSWSDRLLALWNMELELPIVPLGLSFVILLAVAAASQLRSFSDDGSEAADNRRELVEVGGNTYWKDDYERAVAAIENKDQG
ncbi:hypothetical protein J4772_28600 [Cohnella sp. LGH]|uniref:hypothetical protein n=1 Tax=Cohnella sp. LGH TaxID=1619153 RepID=UPI001ADBD88B|nr:hypothetical protein [Cohnella sp. LGH]QTH41465.1 hypothetical protein J4772_28600 [Cohnella sp. LGH]